MCGADPTFARPDELVLGSPPRVRSRLVVVGEIVMGEGITSACAEQTLANAIANADIGDHLRVCGADSCILLCSEPAEWRGIFDLRTA